MARTPKAISGRTLRLKKGPALTAVAIIGSQNDGLQFTNTPQPITDKDDNGYITYHDDWAERQVQVPVSGVLKDAELINIVTSSTASVLLAEYTVEVGDIGTAEGDFWLQNLNLGATTTEGVSFDATFMSSGAYTWTPAA